MLNFKVLISSITGVGLLMGVQSLRAAAGTARTSQVQFHHVQFQGAKPFPIGVTDEAPSQLSIRFPVAINKKTLSSPFKVDCIPAVEGFSSWAENDSLWTYTFVQKENSQRPALVGGATCQIVQTEEVHASGGKKWPVGALNYSVQVQGPKVTEVYVAHGFGQTIREKEPLLLVLFDGPINKASLYGNNKSYLSYVSDNAPKDKITLAAVPDDQVEALFNEFKNRRYIDLKVTDPNWAFITVKQNLIPGATMRLTIQGQQSALNSVLSVAKPFIEEYAVRSQFQAEVECSSPGAGEATCLPGSTIVVNFNGRAKWTDLRETFIEYVPKGVENATPLRAYPEINGDTEVDLLNYMIDMLSLYVPYLAKYSDHVVESIKFNIKAEPETLARVVLPQNLMDIDGRQLSNALTTFHMRIGAMNEWINTPKSLSIYERNMSSLALPVSVVNLNQNILIRKSVGSQQEWKPIDDVETMIQLIRRYENQGEYREVKQYVSPLEDLKIPQATEAHVMTGKRNRPDLLQIPFAKDNRKPATGLYVVELSSPSLESIQSDATYGNYYNPKHVLAQVSDLSVHIKKGQQEHLLWVTQTSTAAPVAGAQLDIYNCLGKKVETVTTNGDGVASLLNRNWSEDCEAGQLEYTAYASKENYFVHASAGDDKVLIHSSWNSSSSYAMASPSIEWFASSLTANQVNYQSIIGVNLVKPGQKVPIQILAFHPTAKGFKNVEDSLLPKVVRVVSTEDDSLYYDFNVEWTQGRTEFTWVVPEGNAAKLGSYQIRVVDKTQNYPLVDTNGDIEVAEFKVPLMSGAINPPPSDQIKPEHLPVTAMIRYANGVGAKNLSTSLSFYFQPTGFETQSIKGFTFGTGPMPLFDSEGGVASHLLPHRERPAQKDGLITGEDGGLQLDIANEMALNGQTVAEVLKRMEQPQNLVLRLRYQDQMGEFQTISVARPIYNSKAYVGTRVLAGEKAKSRLEVAVVDIQNKNRTSLRDLNLKVSKLETKIIGEELYGGIIKNSLQRHLAEASWNKDCQFNEDRVSCAVGALSAGTYVFEVASQSYQQSAHSLFKVDANGRVYGDESYYDFGDGVDSKALSLALDKELYKRGEQAVVSFSPPFQKCQALVTLERSEVLRTMIVNEACEKGQVVVPVDADMAPNVFVSVYLVSGRVSSGAEKIGDQDLGKPTYRLGFANIKVDWQRFRSQVSVTLNKDTYKPRDTVEVKAQITPDMGSLTEGTVTFIAIEEKILQLRANETYQLLNALMQFRYHEVETMSSLEQIETMTGVPRSAFDERKGGDEGGDGGGSEFTRKLFDSLVAFKSGVPVINGEARFSFKANDTLTRFKVFAIAMDANHKFGTGEAAYLSSQDFQTYMNIPSIAYSDDQFPLRVTVQNNSKDDVHLKAEISITRHFAKGAPSDTKSLIKEASITKQGSSVIDFGVLPHEEGATRVDYLVRLYNDRGQLVDVIEQPNQVIYPTVPLLTQNSFLGPMSANQWSQTFKKIESALPEQGELRVTLSNSLVNGALQQIRAKAKALESGHLFLESSLYRSLLLGADEGITDLREIYTLLQNQVDKNGFIKYFPRARSGNIYLTSQILRAIAQRPWALKLMPESLHSKWTTSIRSVLKREVDPDYVGKPPMEWARATTAMAIVAMVLDDGENKELAKKILIDQLIEIERQAKPFGLALDQWSTTDLLAVLALQAEVSPEKVLKSKIYGRLTQNGRLVTAGNMAQLKGAPRFAQYYTDETMDSSELLRLHSRVHGSMALAKSLALGLVNASNKAWYNISTLRTLEEALVAFSTQYETEKVLGVTELQIPELNTEESIPWAEVSVHKLAWEWGGPVATVKLRQNGQGRPWVGIEARAAIPLKESRGQGVMIEKHIRNVTREGGFQTGDVIEVELKINSAARVAHMALHDPIPAGSNIVGEAYGDYSAGEKKYSGYRFYFEELQSGMIQVKYQYQLNNAGHFSLPPTRIEGLYLPSVFAESPNEVIEVQ